jgi:hypothetical protein
MLIALLKSESFPFLTELLYLKNVRPLFDAVLSLILAAAYPTTLANQGGMAHSSPNTRPFSLGTMRCNVLPAR